MTNHLKSSMPDTGLPTWVTIEDIDCAIKAFQHYDAKRLSLHNWRTMLVSMKAYRADLVEKMKNAGEQP